MKGLTGLQKLRQAEKMEMDIIHAEHIMSAVVKTKKKKADPAAVMVYARWKPLGKGQTGLDLKMTSTSIEFEVPKGSSEDAEGSTPGLKRQGTAAKGALVRQGTAAKGALERRGSFKAPKAESSDRKGQGRIRWHV